MRWKSIPGTKKSSTVLSRTVPAIPRKHSSNMAIENPHVIDLISGDNASPCVRLIMLEHREWEVSPERLGQLQDKISAYFNYVASGQLAKDQPDTIGLPLLVELHCAHPPPEKMTPLFGQVGDLCERIRAAFVVYQIDYLQEGDGSERLKVFDSRGIE